MSRFSYLNAVLFFWLPPILWLGIIFIFSSIPNLRSELPTLADVILRKVAHFLEYLVLAYLVGRAASQKNHLGKIGSASIFIFCLLAAAFDELHQGFVSSRTASVIDVGIDSIGSLAGLLLYFKNEAPPPRDDGISR